MANFCLKPFSKNIHMVNLFQAQGICVVAQRRQKICVEDLCCILRKSCKKKNLDLIQFQFRLFTLHAPLNIKELPFLISVLKMIELKNNKNFRESILIFFLIWFTELLMCNVQFFAFAPAIIYYLIKELKLKCDPTCVKKKHINKI